MRTLEQIKADIKNAERLKLYYSMRRHAKGVIASMYLKKENEYNVKLIELNKELAEWGA